MLTYLLVIVSVGYFSLKADKYREAVQSINTDSLALKEERREGLTFLWLAATILILVSGFRYGVGGDYFAYSYSFYQDDYELWKKMVTFKEPGYTFLMIISKLIYYDFTTVTLLTAFITIGLIFYTIQKYSEDYFFSVVLFILLCHWQGSFNAMRQYLAVAILFAGQRYLVEKKLFHYLLIVLIASCFHTTALFMIPCYFLLNIRNLGLYFFCVCIYGTIVYFSNNGFFEIMADIKGIEQSSQSYALRSVNILRTLVSFAPCCLFIFMPVVNGVQREKHTLYLKITILNAILLASTYRSAYLARIAIYSDIFSAVAFPCLFKLYPSSTYKLLKVITISLYIIFWYVDITRRETLLPFMWVFQR